MAQSSHGSYNISNSTGKRPFTIDTNTQHELFDKDSIEAHPVATQTSPNTISKSPNSSKRKRQQPPAAHLSSQQLQGQSDLHYNTASNSGNIYINIPHEIPSQRSIPAFLHKLYNMIESPSTDPFIHWSNDGNSFIVKDHEEFAKLVLPRFYKHNTFASFVRQLNMYNFHKVPHLQQGVLLSTSSNPETEVWEFRCANFQKNRPDLLILVTRKRNRDRQEADANPVNLGALIKEISSIKKHQKSITTDLHNLRRNNETIWQETLKAREKHQKHQKIIIKILQFLNVIISNDNSALNNLDNEEILNNCGQSQHSTAENNIKIKDFSKTISGSKVSNNYCNSALGSSSSGASSSDSGNSSGIGSGSDGDDDLKPTYKNLPRSFDNALNNNDPSKHKFIDDNKNIPNQTVDKKQKSNTNSLPTNATTVMVQPMIFTDAMPQHNARSAQAISDDINQIQENVETLAAQLGIDSTQFSGETFNGSKGFLEHYSNMIMSVSRTDKKRLFDLTDSKKKVCSKQHIPQQLPYIFVSDSNPSYANLQLQSNQNQFSDNASHVDQTTSDNNSPLFFRHLCKSDNPTFEEASSHSINGTTTCNNMPSLDANLYTAYCDKVPLSYTPNGKSRQQQQQFQADDTQLFNASAINRQNLQTQNFPCNDHLSFRHNRQKHNNLKNTISNTMVKEASRIDSCCVAFVSVVPPQPQQHIYDHSCHQTNQFSRQQVSQADLNVCSQQHQQKPVNHSVDTVGDNFV